MDTGFPIVGKGVARKKKTAAATTKRKIVKVVKIKNLGGAEHFIFTEYDRICLFLPS